MSLPIDVGTGTITGRFVIGVIDSPFDADNDPELIPAQGRISFTPSIGYVPNSSNNPAMTIMKSTITGVLDSEGYLCTPDNTSPTGYSRGVNLFATDVGQVTNWTYNVKYSFSTVNGVTSSIPDHPISVPSGSVQDLTTLVKVPSSPGIGIPQMESAVAVAVASARDAINIAQSVRDDANAGVFDGKPAADIRFDTSTGMRVFVTNPANPDEEVMVYGSTGLRQTIADWSWDSEPYEGISMAVLSRTNNSVHLMLNYMPTNGRDFMYTIPVGFRPSVEMFIDTGSFLISSPSGTEAGSIHIMNGSLKTQVIGVDNVPGTGTTGQVSWTTEDPWPTELPGVALV